ncbi:prostaglandin reductase 1-like [Phymastichus coffea]|uniref:prostaglandin reductase 1-like n=1 Tax=Phymastichus coffea TaxID=108790 RepID=UPI00273BB721|nr:prostaglandin reductase 1-like [Phymastichus coffea]
MCSQFLAEAEYLSLDPYMRKVCEISFEFLMVSTQVAKTVQSKRTNYPVGKRIVGYAGRRTYIIMHPDRLDILSVVGREPYLLPDYPDLPSSVALSILGQPSPEKVSGYFRAVDSIVGQIGKLLGLKIIGIAGADRINYKTDIIADTLKGYAEKGVDCCFDNVGDEIFSTVIYQMNKFGRIAVRGSVSSYNSDPTDLPKYTHVQLPIVNK